MAQAIYPSEPANLATLAAKFGYTPKTVPYSKIEGVHPNTMDADLMEEIGKGAAHDCEITLKLFQELNRDFPPEELAVIDMTVQMFTNPRLIGRVDGFNAFAETAKRRVEQTLAGLGVTARELASSKKFQALLEREGVTVEMKPNKRGNPIPAFGKNDDFMTSLLASDNLRGLAEARIAVKSRINETRALRLAGTASRGALPVFLNHCDAGRTSRWSGGDKANWQNFPRTGELGECVEAPGGHVLVIADASQIECRILNFVAGQDDVIEAFKDPRREIYCERATEIYRQPVTPKAKDKRHVGKRTELSSGYGCGHKTLRAAIKADGLTITFELADKAIKVYRASHVTEGDTLILPNGLKLHYDIRYDSVTNNFVRNDEEGGALTGQIVQALAACFFREVLLKVKAELSLMPVCFRHDFVYCVPEADAKNAMAVIDAAFQVAPVWLPGIPLKCECWKSKTYTKAKE